MNTQPIKKTLMVHASKETVWEILVQDEYTRKWYAAFGEGNHADTDWKVGSKATFKDANQCGLIAKVIANTPGDILAVEYIGILDHGKEDYESPFAQQLKGGREIYMLSEENGVTKLTTESDMAPEFFESMNASWDKALAKIKELAEG